MNNNSFSPEHIEKLTQSVAFDDKGLVPVIAQDAESNEILMLAWMNKDALKETLISGRMCYFSRSRNSIWRKGESSGQTQYWQEIFLDCDKDALLAKISQKGVACHTGRKSCFFYKAEEKGWNISKPVITDPATLYKKN